MIEHAVRVGATTARERVPERIAEALLEDARSVGEVPAPPARTGPPGPTRPGRPGDRGRVMTDQRAVPALVVGPQVIARPSASPPSRCRACFGSAVAVRPGATSWAGRPSAPGSATARSMSTVWLVARPRQPLIPLAGQVRAAVGARSSASWASSSTRSPCSSMASARSRRRSGDGRTPAERAAHDDRIRPIARAPPGPRGGLRG